MTIDEIVALIRERGWHWDIGNVIHDCVELRFRGTTETVIGTVYLSIDPASLQAEFALADHPTEALLTAYTQACQANADAD